MGLRRIDYVGTGRMLRGGSWSTYADKCRVANLWADYIDYGGTDMGFRTVLPVDQE